MARAVDKADAMLTLSSAL